MATRSNAKHKKQWQVLTRARKEISLAVGDVWEFTQPTFHILSGTISHQKITVEILSLGSSGMMSVKKSNSTENKDMPKSSLLLEIVRLKAKKVS